MWRHLLSTEGKIAFKQCFDRVAVWRESLKKSKDAMTGEPAKKEDKKKTKKPTVSHYHAEAAAMFRK
eukprot:3550935-Amphidinium_carterae.2